MSEVDGLMYPLALRNTFAPGAVGKKPEQLMPQL
jgi:hypothetical protein